MNIIETGIEGLVVIEPRVFLDDRGYFYESYNANTFHKAGITNKFVQDNESASTYGVIRGLHYQIGDFAQAKLVRVLKGKVLDVAVDLRPDSDTYGKVFSIELSYENKKQLLVPRGFAHGFSVMSETAIFAYKCDNFYSKESEGSIAYNDPKLNIDWKIRTGEEVLSPKDLVHPCFGNHRK